MTPEQFYSESKWPEMKDKFDKTALIFNQRDLCEFANDYAQQELQAENNMKTEWISVKDRLPDGMIDVLIFDPFGNDMIVGWFNTKYNKWVSGLSAPEDYFEIDVEPTHWMPLPPPPEPPKP